MPTEECVRRPLNMLEVGKRGRMSDLQFGEKKIMTRAFHKQINVHVKKAVLGISKSENIPPMLI